MSFFSDLDRLWGEKTAKPPPNKEKPRSMRWPVIIIGILVFLFILATIGKGIYTEWLWFGSLGFSNIYTTILTTRLWLFFAGALVFFALLVSNLFLARAVCWTPAYWRQLFFSVSFSVC